MIAYVIVICTFFILFTLLRILIAKILLRMGKNNVSLSTVNSISLFLTAVIIVIPFYIYIKSLLETDNFEISNFKLEKCVIIKEPDFIDYSKTNEELWVFYSFDIKNTDDDIKNFGLNIDIGLMNFNNMGDYKNLDFRLTFYDSAKKIKKFNLFDDLTLFKQNETLKVICSRELNNEEIKWLTDNIPFNPEIEFRVSGKTSSGDIGLKKINNNIDLTKFKEDILNSYKDPNIVTLEWFRKNTLRGGYKLKKNIWSDKLKDRRIDAIDIHEYFIIK